MLPTGFLNLLTTISGILLPHFGTRKKAASECLIVADNAFPTFSHEDLTILRIDEKHAMAERYHNLIKHEVFCAIGVVFDKESLNLVMRFLKLINRHMIMAFTKENTILKNDNSIFRPLLWAQPSKTGYQEKLRIKRWCPTVGKVKNKGFHDYMICLNKTDTCQILPGESKMCPSPLWRQKLTLGNMNVPKYSLPTELTGHPIAGLHVRAFQLLAEKNHATGKIVTDKRGVGRFTFHNMSFSPGLFNDVIQRRVEIGIAGGYGVVTNIVMDLPAFLGINEAIFASRTPKSVMTLDNISKPFSSIVWFFFAASLLSISIYLKVAHCAYNSLPKLRHVMIKQENYPSNFFIYPFCKITEPEALPWFKSWSSGRFGVALWMLLSLHMIIFYSMNLRAHLIIPDYEKQIDTLQDVLDNNERTWIYKYHLSVSKPVLRSIGMENSVLYKIADLAERTEGLWTGTKSNTGIVIDPRIGKDVSENGATFLTNPIDIRYLYKTGDPYLQRHRLHLGKENAQFWYTSLAVAKHSPATEYVSKVSRAIFESGLTLKYETEHLPGTALFNVKAIHDGLTPLILENFSSAFMLYFIFVLTSLATFLMELRTRG